MARVFVALLLVALATQVTASIKFQSVERKINLASQFARINEVIKAKNTGDRATDRVILCHAKQPSGALAYHKVTQGDNKAVLQVTPASPPDAPAEAACWEVVLKEPAAAGAVVTLESQAVFADVQTAYPAELAQGEPQLMLYHDNVYVLSPYQVSAQTTEVTLPKSNIKSYTDGVKPVTKSDTKVKYGKYELAKPWSVEPMRLHYENNRHFKKALSLVREIEVSHWGNIYVEESYELKNAGALHKGAFSRLRYAHSVDGKTNAFQDLKARLPASAHSLYYVDIIGNISTSDVRKGRTETTLDFLTRYPLMGGWKVDFKIGYSVPLKGFLHSVKGGKRRLTMDFSTPLEDVYVQDLTVKVVLPEGASAVTTQLPYEVQQSFDTKYTYLDISGRPVVVLRKTNLVPEHAAKFHVYYSFPAFGTVREPLMLIAAFATFFVAVIAYNRLEFTIAKDDKWLASRDAEAVATVMQQINGILDEEDEVLDRIATMIASIRSAEDVDAIQKERNAVDAAFNTLENQAKDLINTVRATQPKVAEKVEEVHAKARALQQRMMRQLLDKCDLCRKGTPTAEVNKKLAGNAVVLQDARKDLAAAVETLFAPY